jgi:hypothetical protein
MGHHNMLLPVGHERKKERTIFDNIAAFLTTQVGGWQSLAITDANYLAAAIDFKAGDKYHSAN